MKYVKWNRTRALAAVCAVILLLSAARLTAYADNTEVIPAAMQQETANGLQGRMGMRGGPRQGGPREQFTAENGEQPPEKPDEDFAPPADGEQPPEKPDEDFAPPADGEQPPEKPADENSGDRSENDMTKEQGREPHRHGKGFSGRFRNQFRKIFQNDSETNT